MLSVTTGITTNNTIASRLKLRDTRKPAVKKQTPNPRTVLTSHDLALAAVAYASALFSVIVQELLPNRTHWFLRGVCFYLTMVISFKPLYATMLAVCAPGKIVLPGQNGRHHYGDNEVPKQELVKGFVGALLLRGLTFISTSDAYDMQAVPSAPLSLSLPTLLCWVHQIIVQLAWMLVYDFFYYWLHRMLHQVPFLWRHAHAHHHSIAQPFRGVTLLHTVWEMIGEILLPTFAAQAVFACSPFGGPLSTAELVVAYTNIQIMEVMGHSGTAWCTSSFAFCPWLPRALGIELRVEDHDAHHAESGVNFSKQSRIWDRLFGTHQNGHRVPHRILRVRKWHALSITVGICLHKAALARPVVRCLS